MLAPDAVKEVHRLQSTAHIKHSLLHYCTHARRENISDILIQLCNSLGVTLSIGINVNGMAGLQVWSVCAIYMVGNLS